MTTNCALAIVAVICRRLLNKIIKSSFKTSAHPMPIITKPVEVFLLSAVLYILYYSKIFRTKIKPNLKINYFPARRPRKLLAGRNRFGTFLSSRSSSGSGSFHHRGKYYLKKRSCFCPNLRSSGEFLETLRQQCCPQSEASSDERSNFYLQDKPSVMIQTLEEEKNSSLEKSSGKTDEETKVLEMKDLGEHGDCNWPAGSPEPRKKLTRTTRSGKIYCTF